MNISFKTDLFSQVTRTSVMALLLAGLTAGCAINDEGAVDYRRAKIPPVADATQQRNPEPQQLIGKYAPADDRGAYLTKGEYYEIKLRQGLIADFWDLPGFLSGSFEELGEVAIVVNAFEVGDNGKSLSFDPDSRQQARVIYFSGDVVERQYLNLSQLPIYGPAPYNGNAIVVQIYGIEIDQLSDRTRALLSVLASLGNSAATAYNPLAGMASGMLTKLASAFLNGNHDDVIFTYTFTLAAPSPSTYVEQDYLSEGTRVFTRQQKRKQDFNWDQLTLDPMSGRLMKGGSEYRDETYLVVDVTRTTSKQALPEGQKLTQLLEKLRTADSLGSAEEVEKLKTDASQLVLEVVGAKFLEDKMTVIGNPRTQPVARKAEVFGLLEAMQSSLKTPSKAVMSEAQIQAGLDTLRAKLPAGVTLAQLTREAIQQATAAQLEAIAEAYKGT